MMMMIGKGTRGGHKRDGTQIRRNHLFWPSSKLNFENAGSDTLMSTSFMQKEYQRTHWIPAAIPETVLASWKGLDFRASKPAKRLYRLVRRKESRWCASNPSFSNCNLYAQITDSELHGLYMREVGLDTGHLLRCLNQARNAIDTIVTMIRKEIRGGHQQDGTEV